MERLAATSGAVSPNVLFACVLEARGLVTGDEQAGTPSRGAKAAAAKSINPYVKVRFSGQEFTSRTERKSQGRVHWDERVDFIGARGSKMTKVEFKVYDKRTLGKIFLGKAEVSVNTVRELKREFAEKQREVNRGLWLKLTDAYGTQGDFGELRVVVGWLYRRRLAGKTRLAVYSRIGIKRTAKGAHIGILDDAELQDDEDAALSFFDDDLDEDTDNEDDLAVSPEAANVASEMGAAVDENEDGDDDEVSGIEGAMTEEDKEEEKDAMERRQREEQDALENAMQLDIKPGAYRVIFHVIEVRELHPEDLSGTSDPVCTVTIDVPARKTVTRSTSIKKAVRSCVFDEQLFLDLNDMDENTVEAATIKFSVFDADLISRNDLIGSFTFNLIDVYYRVDHAHKNQWIGLIDEKNPKDTGVQGYAKVSVTVVGPGDTVNLDEDDDAKNDDGVHDEEIAEVLLPPNVQQELRFLRAQVYIAEDLPALDRSKLTGTEGLDAFVKMKFSGNPPCKTSVVSVSRPRTTARQMIDDAAHRRSESLRVVFNEELWMPTFNPRLARNVNISVYDYDKASSNDLVSTLLVNYQDVIRSTPRFPRKGGIVPRWYMLYGAPRKSGLFGNEDAEEMNRNPAKASAYRGRILLSFRNYVDREDSEEPETIHKKHIRSIKRSLVPPTRPYVLRFWAIAGSSIPRTQGAIGFKSRASVASALSMGPYKLSTRAVTPGEGATVDWVEAHEATLEFPAELLLLWESPQVQAVVDRLDNLEATIARHRKSIPDDALRLRSDPSRTKSHGNPPPPALAGENTPGGTKDKLSQLDYLERQQMLMRKYLLAQLQEAQVPDLFLYLEDSSGRAISFARFRPEEILLERFRGEPRWVTLAEDKANNRLDDDDFPGSVLVRIGLGPQDLASATQQEWTQEQLDPFMQKEPFALRVHVYQGKDLPAADSDGMSDPYARVRVLGEKAGKVSRRTRTNNPLWYETVTFSRVLLPPARFAPQAVIDVYDYDRFDPDDYLGSSRILLAQPGATAYATTKPEWRLLFQVAPGDCADAAILVSTEIFPLREGNPATLPPVPNIRPTTHHKATLQIAVLGLRNLAAFRGIPVQNSLVEFHLGDASRQRNVHRTKRSKRPTGSDPNFGELIELKFKLPEDLIFLPRLQVTVQDARVGGLKKEVVATSAVDLMRFVPTSPDYVPHGGAPPDTRNNPNIENQDDHGQEHELERFLALTSPAGQDPALGGAGGRGGAAGRPGEAADALDEAAEDPPTIFEEDDDDGFITDDDAFTSGASDASSDVNDSLPSDTESDVSDSMRGNTILEFEEWANHDPLPLPQFMKGRKTYEHELEAVLGPTPFESFPLFRGQRIRKSLIGKKLKPNLRNVGTLKAAMRVLLDAESPSSLREPNEEDGVFATSMLDKMLVPRPVEVRLNVLKGFNFIPMDVGGGKSDPYLSLKLGRIKVNDQKNYIPNSINPNFYRSFILHTELPGPSQLRIRAMDYDLFSSDDLIGETTIDIEDRWFSKRWKEIAAEESLEERTQDELDEEEAAKVVVEESRDADTSEVETYLRKPVELRSIWTPTSQLEQGKVELWCDIMDQPTAIKYPMIDVSPPADTVYEMRVIIWKCEDVPSFDFLTKQNDLYVRCNFNGFSEKSWKETDTHWRAKKGKGSWNYRIKMPNIQLPLSKLKSRLTIQIWDRDVTKWNDLIAETVLDLSSHLRAAYLRNEERYEVFDSGYRRAPRPPPKPAREPSAPTPVVSTREEFVQMPANGNFNNADEEQKNGGDDDNDDEGRVGRQDSSISIRVDPDTGVAATNADPDDLDSQYSTRGREARKEKRHATRMERKRKKQEEKRKQRVKVSAGGESGDPEEEEKRGEANELINTYAPWAGSVLSHRDPPNSKALKLYSMENGVKRDMGKLWVSVELVRQDLATTSLSNGGGRSEPNRFPKLPKPVGRLNWKLFWNPFYVLRECLGPDLCVKFCCVFIILVAIVLTVVLFPQVTSLFSFLNTIPHGVGYLLIALVALVIVGACCWCGIADRRRRNKEEEELARAYDLEAQAFDREKEKQYLGTEGRGDDEPVRNCCGGCCRSRSTPKQSKREKRSSASGTSRTASVDAAELEMLNL
ncbi:Fer-1-like protein 4 [Hondaea fermentalgiana]|uniref:Fer-1-like protein 4 n=1 Tax=Hondaea fermentalgiana TaxID=2315210 RepID=A0A2R5GAR2_9STRA|nr:Fer-1-like protein 4 [Hondaea fermentalgiana]|eukprot:GBG24784.1 Fer-1-like protein 4 [Hondaea fermentalgiana]